MFKCFVKDAEKKQTKHADVDILVIMTMSPPKSDLCRQTLLQAEMQTTTTTLNFIYMTLQKRRKHDNYSNLFMGVQSQQ